MQHKTCSACKVEKPLSNFTQNSDYRDGYRRQCNACRAACNRERRLKKPDARRTADKAKCRNYNLNKKYNINSSDYERMLNAQKRRGAICRSERAGAFHGLFVVDHCHITGVIRGLLCNRCNVGLGCLGDTLQSASRFIAYLKKSQTKTQPVVRQTSLPL